MRQVGRLAEIWRYPVSSLRGERLDEAELDGSGIFGDRIWGMADAVGSVANSSSEKRWRVAPQLLSRLRGGVEISADGEIWSRADSHEAREAASRIAGFPVDFQPYASPDAVPGARAPRYQRAGVHLLTTASLRVIRAELADVAVDARRFRPNLVIDTEDEGLVEQEWIGDTIAIGQARIAIAEPCARCSFVALAQDDLSFAPSVLHAVTRLAHGDLGVYGQAAAKAVIRVGDPVFLV